MNCGDVRKDLEVRTVFNLGTTVGMIINPRYLDARKPDAEGVVRDWVLGHGGDVWWVEHKDGSIGAYCFDEFNPR